MTADVINLRKARKAKERADKETRAAENRVKFGRTKQERVASETSETLRLSRLEQHRRDPQDRGDVGSNGSNATNVIDSRSSEPDRCEKPAPAFSHPALDGDGR